MFRKLRENVSYFFFKRRLKKKLAAFYTLEDPWRSAELYSCFEPFLRSSLQLRAQSVLSAPVLDAGGGEGWFRKVLDPLQDYHLLDIEQKALDRAKKRIGEKSTLFINASLDRFRPPPDTYGAIFLISILNFLGRDRHPGIYKNILHRLALSLKPGGVTILIHPFYKPEEKNSLLSLGEDLMKQTGIEKMQTLVLPGKQQSFLCELYQKRTN